jgi:hypothetical protein
MRVESASKRPPSRGLSKATSVRSKRGETDPERKSSDPERKPSSSKVRRDYEKKLDELEEDHKQELDELKAEYEEKLKSLRDQCIEKDQRIANYWHEIQRFQRLPNSHDGKLITSGLLNGHASKMPEIGRYAKDGYLLASKSRGPKYAVFYYKHDEEVE